jgi:hypothetical protein
MIWFYLISPFPISALQVSSLLPSLLISHSHFHSPIPAHPLILPSNIFPSTSLPLHPSHPSPLYLIVDKAETLLFSYDVFWEKSDVEWSSRWDAYLLANAPNDKVRHLIGGVGVVVDAIAMITVFIIVYYPYITPFWTLF